MLTEEIKTERVANINRPASEIIPLLPEAARAGAYVVGAWIWIEFQSKPSEETRTELKRLGFNWNKDRGLWQHCGGIRRKHTYHDPREYYGIEPIEGQEVPR